MKQGDSLWAWRKLPQKTGEGVRRMTGQHRCRADLEWEGLIVHLQWKGRGTSRETKKVMGDEIRTFLGKISMRLKQNKNWKHLVEIAFFQNINEGGWRWCNAESSYTCLLRASALLMNAHEVYCGQDLIRELWGSYSHTECASLKHIHHPCFPKQSQARQHLKPSDVFKSI